MEEAEEYQTGEEIIPVEQATILFYDKPLVVVFLPDGSRGVVVRSLCDNMQLDRPAQIRRIQRTEAITDDLVSNVRIETDGGPQGMHVLLIRAVAYWLATIDAKRVRPEIRPDVVKYQKEVVDVLYAWATQAPHALRMPEEQKLLTAPESTMLPEHTTVAERPASYFPAPLQPQEPEPGASDAEKSAYYESLAAWALWMAGQHAQVWRDQVQTQLESLQVQLEAGKAVTDLIPEMLVRLGPPTITPEQQGSIRGMVQRLAEVSSVHPNSIHWQLSQAFQVAKYQQILESQYEAVCHWFNQRIEAAKHKKRGKL
jgi:hypothetical protein